MGRLSFNTQTADFTRHYCDSRLKRVGSVLSRSDPFLYGIIQFGPKAELAPVIKVHAFVEGEILGKMML